MTISNDVFSEGPERNVGDAFLNPVGLSLSLYLRLVSPSNKVVPAG